MMTWQEGWPLDLRVLQTLDPKPHALQAMADQGSGGAFEISQRMTAMLGWGATSDFKEDWTWKQAAETYALDPDMAEKLRKNNPEVRPCLPCLHSCSAGRPCLYYCPIDWSIVWKVCSTLQLKFRLKLACANSTPLTLPSLACLN